MQEERLLVGKNDAAQILGLSLRTIDYLIARNSLRVRRIGKRVLISRSELARFANSEELIRPRRVKAPDKLDAMAGSRA